MFVTTFQLSRILGAMLYNRSHNKIVTKNKKENSLYEPKVSFVIPCKDEENGI